MSSSGGFQARTPEDNPNAVFVHASSGNVAAGVATAILPAVAGKSTYLSGLEVTGAGSTAGAPLVVTATDGTVTLSWVVTPPTGPNQSLLPLTIELPIPAKSAATNTAWTVSVPSFGAGNTNAAVTAHGFQL